MANSRKEKTHSSMDLGELMDKFDSIWQRRNLFGLVMIFFSSVLGPILTRTALLRTNFCAISLVKTSLQSICSTDYVDRSTAEVSQADDASGHPRN